MTLFIIVSLSNFFFLIHIHNTFKLKIQENNRGAVQNKLTFLAEMSAKGVFKTLVLLNLNLNFCSYTRMFVKAWGGG